MDLIQNILTFGFLIGVLVFILPFFGEMFFEAVLLFIEQIDYKGSKK